MKPILIFTVLVFFIAHSLFAQQRSVTYPAYEFRATSIYEIQKIESSAAETRVHLLCRFIPGWWVNFSSETFIRPSGSEEKLPIRSMVGGIIGEQITMPASGDSAIVLVFPPLPTHTLAIDLAEDGNPVIFGLSLERSMQPTAAAKPLPKGVQQWIDQAIANSNVKEQVVYGTDAFFSRDTARLMGYIDGYDSRAGFSTGLIHAGNELTGQDNPIVVSIYEDGRFEARIPMQYPLHTQVIFEQSWVPFYIEPGQTLSLVLDWADFLEANRLRNRPYDFQHVVFGGPLARMNDELRQLAIPRLDYQALKEKQLTLTPSGFKRAYMPVWQEAIASLDNQLAKRAFLPQTGALLRAELMVSHGTYLLDFLSNRDYYARQDTANAFLQAPVEDDYLDFLAGMPLDNPLLLATRDFATFINRFEFCSVFSNGRHLTNLLDQPQKSWNSYLFQELGLVPGEADLAFLEQERTFSIQVNQAGITDSVRQELIKQYSEAMSALNKRYAKEMDDYKEKYIASLPSFTPVQRASARWQITDSLLQRQLGMEHSFAYEVTKIRSLPFTFKNELAGQKDDARVFLTELANGINHPFLLAEAERLFHGAFPNEPKQAYALPEGRGTAVFKRLIDPHKGKYVIVDFWATTCAPCVYSIKNHKSIREQYRDNPDFEFVFVTSTYESPQRAYDDFIAEQELTYTHRLSADDFRLLRQLFKFNGIPRYIVIDPEGRVFNDDFEMYNFKSELEKIMAMRGPVSDIE